MSGAKKAPPDALSEHEMARVLAWAAARYPNLRRSTLEELVEDCLDYHHERGRSAWKADYVRACYRWIRQDQKWKREGRGAGGKRPERREFAKEIKDPKVIDLADRIGRRL